MAAVVSVDVAGYETQAKQVWGLLDAARAGLSALAVVTGEAGVGRSTFLRAVAETAQNPFLVVSSQGDPGGQRVPFGVAARVLAAVLDLHDEAGRARLLVAGGPAVRRLLSGGFADPAEAAAEQDAVLRGLRALYRELTAHQPLLITVDDVDWVDHPSQRWLVDAGGSSVGRIAVALARARHPLPACRELLPEVGAAVDIRLGGLPARVVRQLAEHRCAMVLDAAQIDAVLHATGGVPALVRELLLSLTGGSTTTAQEIRAAAPAAVADELHQRLARSDPVLLDVARSIAILGDDTTLLRVAWMAHLDVPTVLSAVDTLVAAGVLRNSHPFAFVHPVVHNAVREHLPLGCMVYGHLTAAILLREAGLDHEVIATHLVAGGPADLDWAADTLRAAARQAVDRDAPEAAARYLRHALSEQVPADLRTVLVRELDQAELLVTSRGRVRAVSPHSGEDPFERDQARPRAELPLLVADALAALGQDADAVALRTGTMRDLDAAPVEAAVADQLVVRPIPEWRGLRAFHLAHRGERREQATRWALDVVRSAEANQRRTPGYWYALLTLLYADELDTVEAHAMPARTGENAGSVRHIAAALHLRGLCEARRGHLCTATELLTQAVDALRAAGMDGGVVCRIGVAHLVEVLVRRGLLDAAREALGTVDLATPRPDRAAGHLLYARGRLRLGAGDLTGGLDDLLAAGRLLRAARGTNPALADWRHPAVRVLLARDQLHRAVELATETLALALRWGTAREVGAALHTAALCCEDRAGLLRKAVVTLERTEATLELTDALVDLGIALQGAGKPLEARDCLSRAVAFAQRCDATPLRHQALAGLATTAGPAGAAEARRGLATKREARVVALARRGWTNREISQELHISQRTVELHLSNVYRKFGISGRRELGLSAPIPRSTSE